MSSLGRTEARHRRARRIRKALRAHGRLRLSVYRSHKHIYAQVIDDHRGHTLLASSSRGKAFGALGGNTAAAAKVGQDIAQKAQQAGITEVVFDRGGCLYHGRVRALAEAAREGGLRF